MFSSERNGLWRNASVHSQLPLELDALQRVSKVVRKNLSRPMVRGRFTIGCIGARAYSSSSPQNSCWHHRTVCLLRADLSSPVCVTVLLMWQWNLVLVGMCSSRACSTSVLVDCDQRPCPMVHGALRVLHRFMTLLPGRECLLSFPSLAVTSAWNLSVTTSLFVLLACDEPMGIKRFFQPIPPDVRLVCAAVFLELSFRPTSDADHCFSELQRRWLIPLVLSSFARCSARIMCATNATNDPRCVLQRPCP